MAVRTDATTGPVCPTAPGDRRVPSSTCRPYELPQISARSIPRVEEDSGPCTGPPLGVPAQSCRKQGLNQRSPVPARRPRPRWQPTLVAGDVPLRYVPGDQGTSASTSTVLTTNKYRSHGQQVPFSRAISTVLTEGGQENGAGPGRSRARRRSKAQGLAPGASRPSGSGARPGSGP